MVRQLEVLLFKTAWDRRGLAQRHHGQLRDRYRSVPDRVAAASDDGPKGDGCEHPQLETVAAPGASRRSARLLGQSMGQQATLPLFGEKCDAFAARLAADQILRACIFPDGKSRAGRLPGLHQLGMGAWLVRHPFEQLQGQGRMRIHRGRHLL